VNVVRMLRGCHVNVVRMLCESRADVTLCCTDEARNSSSKCDVKSDGCAHCTRCTRREKSAS
jgi:hypothetical protein